MTRLRIFRQFSLLARTPVVVYAHPSFAASNLKEMLALSKSKPWHGLVRPSQASDR